MKVLIWFSIRLGLALDILLGRTAGMILGDFIDPIVERWPFLSDQAIEQFFLNEVILNYSHPVLEIKL